MRLGVGPPIALTTNDKVVKDLLVCLIGVL